MNIKRFMRVRAKNKSLWTIGFCQGSGDDFMMGEITVGVDVEPMALRIYHWKGVKPILLRIKEIPTDIVGGKELAQWIWGEVGRDKE